MRILLASLIWLPGAFALSVPLAAHAQQPDPLPSTTQSQSGYPDVRKEAADPGLFPDPDKVAGDLVRRKAVAGADGAGVVSKIQGRNKRGGLGRVNSQSLGDADTDPLPVRVAYRRAKTLAMERDPGLATLLKRADLATTDVEKRQYLKVYYTQLFAEVRRIDSSPAMKSHLDALKESTEQNYDPKRRAVAEEKNLINGRESPRRGLAR